jgi:hypothetical protein
MAVPVTRQATLLEPGDLERVRAISCLVAYKPLVGVLQGV